eukprot:UN23806
METHPHAVNLYYSKMLNYLETTDEKNELQTYTIDYALHEFDTNKAFKMVDYVVLDAGGTQVEALLGMNLEDNSQFFPMISIELGGTWINPTLHKNMWSQGDMARYLESLGYELYLMGGLDRSEAEAK